MKIDQLRFYARQFGPGIAVAATGVGAGDMVAAAVSGSEYGFAIVWAAAVGAFLKYVLNDGLARWQLATGTTLLQGWVTHLGRWVQIYFLIYLLLWSLTVGAALISACGLAAHAIWPVLSVPAWGALHAAIMAAMVVFGGYVFFERTMKVVIGLMFVTLVGCAIWIEPPVVTFSAIVGQAGFPAGSSKFILGVIGGVGGSLTLLAYGYWMREKKWSGETWRGVVRFDLIVSYALTGVFGVAVMVLASAVLHDQNTVVRGARGVVDMAGMLGAVLGRFGHWAFLLGFWGAVATSMLGVWQGVPYMFCDFVGLMRKLPDREHRRLITPKSNLYRGYLFWLAGPPVLLVILGKPVGLIILYSIVGALFMPFLAATLLYMNSRTEWVGEMFRNSWATQAVLSLALLLFGYLCVDELYRMLI